MLGWGRVPPFPKSKQVQLITLLNEGFKSCDSRHPQAGWVGHALL